MSPVNPLRQTMNDVSVLIDQVNAHPELQGKENLIHAAGVDLQNSMGSLMRGMEAFEKGDVMGGASQVLGTITSLSNMLALAGPFGAIAGALLGAITSLISAILDAFKPAVESLESKLKRMIEEETLNQAYIALAGGKAEWDLADKKIYMLARQRQAAVNKLAEDGLTPAQRAEYEAVAAGWTWEELTQNIGWERHKGRISAAFMTLSKKRGLGSPEWMALFDITIAYAFSFYLSFESMRGLVGNPPSPNILLPLRPENSMAPIGPPMRTSVASLNNIELFDALRKIVLRQLRDDIDSVYFEFQNNSQFYHLYKNNNRDYLKYKGYSLESVGDIYQRTGVIGDNLRPSDPLGAKGASFAVTSRGTIFYVGRTAALDDDVLYVGRGGNWPRVAGAKCDQVFVKESSGADKVWVFCLYNYGRMLAACDFNDADGAGGEGSPRDWAPNASRWGTWVSYDFTAMGKTILTIVPTPSSNSSRAYDVYALAYDPKSKDINLYKLDLKAAKRNAPELVKDKAGIASSPTDIAGSPSWGVSGKVLPAFDLDGGTAVIEGYRLAGGDVSKYMYSADLDGRSAPSPCAVSYNDGSFTVQYGHRLIIPIDGNLQVWDLRDEGHLGDSQVKVYQGRHYPDGSIVVTTDKSVQMLYRLTPNNPTRWGYSKGIETICSWKQCSTQAKGCIDFYNRLNKEVQNL